MINISTAGDGDLSNISMDQTDNTHWYRDWPVPAGTDDDGTFTVKIYATDNATNTLNPNPTTNATKKIDNTLPTCTIEYNLTASYFKSGDALKIYANFTEADSGIDPNSVVINISTVGDGGLDNTSMTQTDITHWYKDWTIPAGADENGTFTVKIYASDNVSNNLSPYPTTNNSKSIDNSEPNSVIGYPEDGQYYESVTNISGTSTDGPGSGISAVTITIYNSTDGTYWTGTTWSTTTNLSVTGTTTWWRTTLPTFTNEKTYIVNSTATDVAGNIESTSASNTFTLDNAAPQVSTVLITDTNTTSTTYVKDGDTINVTATIIDGELNDGDTGYLKADLTGFGGTADQTATGYVSNTAWWLVTDVTCTPSDGTITVSINATDPAGNYNNTESDSITADNTIPTISYAVLDADYNGNLRTYMDVYFSESTMNFSTAAITDFSISTSGVSVGAIEGYSASRITLNMSAKISGGGPTLSIAGDGIQDLAGNTITTGSTTVNTYRISLNSGWNLLSIPADVGTVSLPTLLSSIWDNINMTTNILRYNAGSSSWLTYSPSLQSGTFSYIEPGKAYWINMNASDTLVGNYSAVLHGTSPPPIVELTGHKWNMIGHWGTYNQSADTSGGLASLSDVLASSGEILYKYSPSGGFTNIYGSSTTNMESGEGYWLYLKTSNTGYYTLAES